MEEKSLSENESLLIISQMIERAKSEQKDDAKMVSALLNSM